MVELKMKHLEEVFHAAKNSGERYVAIAIKMDGFEDIEIIINPIANADAKLEYYKGAYDNELNHKHSKGISIVGITYGNSFDEIEEAFSEDVEVDYED